MMFDNRGITLKDVIRVTVNTEAAHSPPLERLMIPEGEEDKARFRVVKDSEIHILSHITVCGVRYSHAIVIQAALHLYQKLTRNTSIWESKGEVGIPVFLFHTGRCILSRPGLATFRRWARVDHGRQREVHFAQSKGSAIIAYLEICPPA